MKYANQFGPKMERLEDFDLSNRSHRATARMRGFDVPKMNPGPKPKDFWSLVNKTDSCWLWNGNLNRDGYGVYHINGKTHMAHRWAWYHCGGQIPNGMILMHTCDVPCCVNPDHLKVGTHVDNQHDKVIKGRQAFGERNGSSKLKECQVLEIRSLARSGLIRKEIANRYGVCIDTIHKAIHGIYWKHL